MTKSDTWMAFYVGDYLTNTMHLTTRQHGGYLLLILAAWKGGGWLPGNDAALTAIARLSPKEWKEDGESLKAFFTLHNGQWLHERVAFEWQEAHRLSDLKSKAGREGAHKRWGGRANGKTIAHPLRAQRQNDAPSPSPLQEESKKDIAANAARDLEEGDAEICSQLRTGEGAGNQGTALAEHPGPNGSARSAGNSAIDTWNTVAERCGWPKVQQRSLERIKAGAARLGDLGGLEGWTIALGKAEASNFVRTQMTAFGYDWVTKRKNLTKLMEGNYDDRKSTGAPNANGHGTVAAFADAAALLRDKQYSGL